jgi:predicted enzyme related to lactoylglutathione lyase
MRVDFVFAGIPVVDRDAALAWYERALGRPPDLVPNADEAAWQLTDSAWICLERDPAHAGAVRHTVLVGDLHALVAELEGRGAPPAPIETIPGKALTAVLTDPDGNRIQLGQPLG